MFIAFTSRVGSISVTMNWREGGRQGERKGNGRVSVFRILSAHIENVDKFLCRWLLQLLGSEGLAIVSIRQKLHTHTYISHKHTHSH